MAWPVCPIPASLNLMMIYHDFFFSIFSGQSISHSLKHLAERRTDIFGVGEDAAKEAAIGNKMGEEETMRGREEKVN